MVGRPHEISAAVAVFYVTAWFHLRPLHLRYAKRPSVLRDLYELEAVLELSRPNLDINYLLELDLEANYVLDVLASRMPSMKNVALYMRVSTVDQHPETQLHDLRVMAQQRGFSIVHEYTDPDFRNQSSPASSPFLRFSRLRLVTA